VEVKFGPHGFCSHPSMRPANSSSRARSTCAPRTIRVWLFARVAPKSGAPPRPTTYPTPIPSAVDPHTVERAWFMASRWSAPLYERPGRHGPRLLGSAWVDGGRDGSSPRTPLRTRGRKRRPSIPVPADPPPEARSDSRVSPVASSPGPSSAGRGGAPARPYYPRTSTSRPPGAAYTTTATHS
jgi:hypothetical protein